MPYKNIVITSGAAAQPAATKTSQFYVGFSTVSNSNIGNKLYDFELIKQDIINNFNIRKGEKVMKPEYGSVIWSLLFEPLTDDIRQTIQDDVIRICQNDPRVYTKQLDIRPFDRGYLIEITLVMIETDQSSNLKLTFDQKLGLQLQ